MKFLSPLVLCVAFAVPAFAGVTVNSPYNGDRVTSPFSLSAYASNCSSQPLSTMAYSLDSGGDITTIHDGSMDVKVSAGKGGHTLHVKAWGDRGAVCVTDVAVTVTGYASESSSGSSLVPSNAVSVSNLQALNDWADSRDGATRGWSSGSTKLVGWPARSGTTREFASHYSGGGGLRYHVSFGDDAADTNFLYDTWVYLNDSAGHIANLEMDLNQVIPNGQTVIYGLQCDGYSNTWDYTENGGTPGRYSDRWVHSRAACNVRNWGRNAWHHIQISYSRDDSGRVTYKSVWLDGHEQALNATVPSAFSLGWGKTLLTNFQVDGLGSSGSSTVYVDGLTIYRW